VTSLYIPQKTFAGPLPARNATLRARRTTHNAARATLRARRYAQKDQLITAYLCVYNTTDGATRFAICALLCVVLWTERIPLDDAWHWEVRLRWCPQSATAVRVELQERTWRRVRAQDGWQYDRDDGQPAVSAPAEEWWKTVRIVVLEAL
jgi:hypothetical protein